MPTAPNPTDQFSRVFQPLFDERNFVSVDKSWMSFFGIPENGGVTNFLENTLDIQIPIIRSGDELPAQTIFRGSQTTNDSNINTEGLYTKLARRIGLVEEPGFMDSSLNYEQTVTETDTNPKTVKERMQERAANIIKELSRRHIRSHNWFARYAMLDGAQPTILGSSDANLKYDFLRNSGNTLTAGTGWNQVGATPLTDVDTLCDAVEDNGNVVPDIAIFASDVYAAFRANASVKDANDRNFDRTVAFMDVRENRYEAPNTAMHRRMVANGFTVRGFFITDKGRKLYVYTLEKTIVDNFTSPPTATKTPSMPLGVALFVWSGARFDRTFGPLDRDPIENWERARYQDKFGFPMTKNFLPPEDVGGGVIDPRMFFAYIDWSQSTAKGTKIITQSSAIYSTTHTDAIGRLNGLIT